ncbi:diaminopimelate epimerase [Buchnera aphidicola]|uniref:diaminopimelate epimerase n=1 Tax=Buchnera aphidicola TaxID=9 RepID=UPI002237685D|nr:diaminopimelate epimerase [Buchnera aphidicola]MCW5197435.1 diaminopimelate epimerase [Buchnera aphidicola (Chaitophorus viminalis)]
MKNKLFFSKMHGLKNDFMVIETLTQKFLLTKKIIQKLSHRNTGIGFDQLLVIESPKIQNTDFHYRIFNSNGSEVEQCGNGARCVAKFIFKKKLIKKKKIIVSTKNRIMVLKVKKNNKFLVNIGTPQFHPKKIPCLSVIEKKIYSLKINSRKISFGVVSVGNPHCVIIVHDILKAQVKKLGSILESHSFFPKKVNVGFMQILNRKNILLRVFERGVGETQSCGSGACAAVMIGIQQNKLSNTVHVMLKGGKITVKFNSKKNCIYMLGSANHIYDGYIYY